MPRHTVADEIVRQLAHIGVKHIFGITGDALNAFTDAIRRHDDIEWLTVRHEETAAFAACAQAELTQTLAVCAGTVGPGALHLVNGLYNAKRDNVPVLAITGQVPRSEADGPYFQETDLNKAFDDVCVFQATLQSEEQLPRLLQQAVSAAVTQRGVAHLAIPTDLAVTKIAKSSPIELYQQSSLPSASHQQLAQLSELINKAKQVSILIGRGCRGAHEQVAALSEHINAPIAHSLKGADVLDMTHPNSIGGIGHVGTPHGLSVLDNCDLLLMLGSDFPYSEFLPKKTPIVQVDLRVENLGRRCPLALGICADVGTLLKQLQPLLHEKTNPQLAKLQSKAEKWQASAHAKFSLNESNTDPIHPQSIVMLLNELADKDAIFCADIGELTVWVARYLNLQSSQRLLSSFNHGSLGVALPAAIGAQSLNRDRQVISMSGDGGFGMLMADLITAKRYQLPLTQIIFNNSKFGFVELEMEASGLPRFATDLVNPDFAKVARACGFEAVRVEHPAELKPALAKALATKGPCLLDVIINPDELIIPPRINAATAFKFMQGKIKELLIERT